jgi:arylsulfatase A
MIKNTNSNKPNIILINADDLGYGDLSCYGASKVKTPNIDRLANEGRKFYDAHAASAVCSPSRYGMLTGRYPLRRNFWGPTDAKNSLAIDTKHLTLGSLLKDANYSTAMIGKWHLGFGETKPDWNCALKPGPLELGFDYFFGLPTVNSSPPYVYVENHHVVGYEPEDPFVFGIKSVTEKWPEKDGYDYIGGAKKAHELYKDEMVGTTFVNKSIEWINDVDKNKPFFLYLATTNIHHPFTPAPQFKGTSDCGVYGDFIHELDWMVGEIHNTIEDMGLADNTLIIFTSDNGGMLNVGGQNAWKAGHQLNGKLLGFKFGAWEGGHRIPFIAKWPGKIPANTISNNLLCQTDLMSTFASIVKRPLEDDEGVDSIDQLETLTGNPENPLRDELVISPNSPAHLFVRKGKWVYIPAQDEGGFQGKKVGNHLLGGAAAFKLTKQKNSDFTAEGLLKDNAPLAQLYDIEKDPYQSSNVYNENLEVAKELHTIISQHREYIEPEDTLGWINLNNT